MDDVVIRAVTSVAELQQVEAVQRAVWGMPDLGVVPYHHLLAAGSAGGGVIGAFDEGGTLIGFCYGFVGLRDGRPLFYSHMAGVLPEHRGREIGFHLKRAQREAALAQGLERMVWTYDPLQSANAHLNLHKLGARASRYYVDYYGPMEDELNRGLPSDRLEVDWWLRDPAVEAAMRGERQPARGETVRIEIPMAFGELRRTDLPLARSWQARTREAFLRRLGEGRVAVDFRRGGTGGVGAYLLQRPEAKR